MYRVAVCDDDPLMAEQNAAMTRRILDGRSLTAESDYHIDAFTSPEPLIERLTAQPKAYDLLLLDIELDGENGVKLAAFLRERQIGVSIIYITGHAGFAMDSFPTRPLDYLLKPVDETRLASALDWDLKQRDQRPKRPIFRTGTRAIPMEDILYLEISGRKTVIHTVREDIPHSETMAKAEVPLLGQGFSHSHFSYLVNLAHIDRIERDAVVLDTGKTIPVSRRYYQPLIDQYIESMK